MLGIMLDAMRESNYVKGYVKAFVISMVTTAIITVIANTFISPKINDEEGSVLSWFIMYRKGIVGVGSVMMFTTLQSILSIKFTLMDFYEYERVDSNGKKTYKSFFFELNELKKFYTGHSWGVLIAYNLFIFIFSASEVEHVNWLFLLVPFIFTFMFILCGALAESCIDSYIKSKKKELAEYIEQQKMNVTNNKAP
jgi:hypothetical protein